MPQRAPRSRPPLILIVNDQEWSARSLESIFGPAGYAVLKAYTGHKGFERAASARPDVIIVDTNLPDMEGLELCRALRDNPWISDSTPILVTTPGHPTRTQRLAALRAGAWEFLGHPLDAEEVLLKLEAYINAKFDADHAREESLVDEVTGLYNVRGLARRARELGSQAFRHRTALSCVVLAPELSPEERETGVAQEPRVVKRVAKAFKAAGRVSDAIGRLGPIEFAVIAVGTDQAGTVKMAERLAGAAQATPDVEGLPAEPLKLRAGYHAVADFHEAPIDPVDMLVRATTALRLSRPDQQGSWIRPYESRRPSAS